MTYDSARPYYKDTDAKHSMRNEENQRYSVEKLVDGRWVKTAVAPSFDAAERHVKIVGGSCRATGRDGLIAAEWAEGVRMA